MSERPLVSVVLSFRNEESVIPELIERLQRALRGAGLAYELVFVNDASSDGSLALLEQQHGKDPAVKVVNMSRRSGSRTPQNEQHAKGPPEAHRRSCRKQRIIVRPSV